MFWNFNDIPHGNVAITDADNNKVFTYKELSAECDWVERKIKDIWDPIGVWVEIWVIE